MNQQNQYNQQYQPNMQQPYPNPYQNQNMPNNNNQNPQTAQYPGESIDYSPKDLPFPENFTSIFDPQQSNLSKHFEDCDDEETFCLDEFKCKVNRCLSKYESKNLKALGLKPKNICEDDDDCSAEQECIKHRCVEDEDEVDVNKRNEDGDPSVNLLFAGSIFLNGQAYDSGVLPDDTFNYDHLFKNIKDDIAKADLAIVDQETVFETDKKNFEKKLINTPTELADAIAKAGFKLVLHGTLYAFAKEEKGIHNTLNFWNTKYPDIKILGITEDDDEDEDNENEDFYYVFEKNDIKISFINYYAFSGNLIPEDKQYYVNIIKKKKIKNLVTKLANETDFVIVCMNWGNKTADEPNKSQLKWAKELTKAGAKLIIGHHPPVVQPFSEIKVKEKTSLVFWSLGHLIADNKRKYSILGAMANVTISKGNYGTYISSYNLIPTINHKEKGNLYSVYKLTQYPEYLFKRSNLNMTTDFKRDDVVKKCKKIMGGLADCY